MPLRALDGDSDVLAFALSERDWLELKKTYPDKSLAMPCCGARAIPKTSKRGLQFFAHSSKAKPCNFRPESPEHEYVKFLIARAAMDAGWTVKTELRDETPTGDVWIADVLCYKGKVRVALEIQLSPQDVNETTHRQNRYHESRVRCAWFMANTATRSSTYHPSKHLPIFMITKPIVGDIPMLQEFDVKLDKFVKELLTGGVKWTEEPKKYRVEYMADECWKCHKPNKQVIGYSFGVYGNYFKTIPNASRVLEEVSEFITNVELKALGLNTVGKFDMFKGKRITYPYCNVCIYCGCPQFNPHVFKKLESIAIGDAIGETKFIDFVSPRGAQGNWVMVEQSKI